MRTYITIALTFNLGLVIGYLLCYFTFVHEKKK